MDKQFEIKIDKKELGILLDALRCHLASLMTTFKTEDPIRLSRENAVKDLTIKIAGAIEDYNYEGKKEVL